MADLDYLTDITKINGEVKAINWMIESLETKKRELLLEFERLQNAQSQS